MESMDGGKRKKIRIQGHKIKSLSLACSLAHRPNNISVHDFHMCSRSPRREKLNLAWKAKHEMSEREKRTKTIVRLFYYDNLFFLLSFFCSSLAFSLFILCSLLRCCLAVVGERIFLAMFHTKVI
jgi:hypothetical protein